ncbi:MAG: hypothetical protein D8M58_11955 [Calditrichaeota bacterium]|nr:MAG: hypothetical protein DWQ03_12740 [Calditrichota bacterium]MBL1206110.1 hypothetical protein [Calditrichota bacterium]NOG45935.1 hypothetical protein [Calditrichota bacterium]
MAWHRCRQKNALWRSDLKKSYKAALNKKDITDLKPVKKGFFKAGHLLLLAMRLLVSWIVFALCLITQSLHLIPTWVAELFRFCPFKPGISKKPFYIIGHRGAAAHKIENTISSFDFAINTQGANALEMDISFTKDKQVVLWHDWLPDDLVATVRQLGFEPDVKYKPLIPPEEKWYKPTHKLTLQEIREQFGYSRKKKSTKEEAYIPSLDEVFDWAVQQASLEMVILDIKTPEKYKSQLAGMLDYIQNCIEKYKPTFKIILMSPEKSIVKEMKKLAPQFNYTYDIELPVFLVLDPQEFSAVDKAVNLGDRFASVGRPTAQLGPWTTLRRLLQYDVFQKTKYAGTDKEIEDLITWTINRKREMRCLLRMGINGIITDRPERLKKVCDKLLKKQDL